MRERDVERAFVDEVKKRGGIAWKFTSPGTDGVPDRLVMFPGFICFVELKAPGKKMRPLQEKRKREIEKMGFLVACIDGKDAQKNFFKKLLLFCKKSPDFCE